MNTSFAQRKGKRLRFSKPSGADDVGGGVVAKNLSRRNAGNDYDLAATTCFRGRFHTSDCRLQQGQRPNEACLKQRSPDVRFGHRVSGRMRLGRHKNDPVKLEARRGEVSIKLAQRGIGCHINRYSFMRTVGWCRQGRNQRLKPHLIAGRHHQPRATGRKPFANCLPDPTRRPSHKYGRHRTTPPVSSTIPLYSGKAIGTPAMGRFLAAHRYQVSDFRH